MTEEELKQLLESKLYEMADAMMLFYDPCHIEGGACKAGDPNPCCKHTRFGDPCPFLDHGCHNPNAWCRLWICRTAIASTNPKCVEGLTLLEHFGNLFDIVRKPMIGQAYVGADRPKT